MQFERGGVVIENKMEDPKVVFKGSFNFVVANNLHSVLYAPKDVFERTFKGAFATRIKYFKLSNSHKRKEKFPWTAPMLAKLLLHMVDSQMQDLSMPEQEPDLYNEDAHYSGYDEKLDQQQVPSQEREEKDFVKLNCDKLAAGGNPKIPRSPS